MTNKSNENISNPTPFSENLKYLRNKESYSQEHVAEKIGLDIRNYQKWESGETKRPKAKYVNALLKLYPKVSEKELFEINLKEQEQSRKHQSEFWKEQGNIKKSFLMSGSTLANYLLVDKEYGLTIEQLVVLAPLLFTILAEMSLKWRRERQTQHNQIIEALQNSDNLFSRITGNQDWKTWECGEEESIQSRDVFGEKLDLQNFGFDMGEYNPFAEYLKSQTNGTTIKIHDDYEDCPDFVGDEDETPMQGKIPSYNILPETLHKIFGEHEALKPNADGEYNYSVFAKLMELPQLKSTFEALEELKWRQLTPFDTSGIDTGKILEDIGVNQ